MLSFVVMGYYSNFSGKIKIDPPLNWEEIKSLGEPEALDNWSIGLLIEEEQTDTAEGILTRRYANALVPCTDESMKGYDALTNIEYVVKKFPNRSYEGHILREGEESGDISRIIVRDGKVIEQKAEFKFPD